MASKAFMLFLAVNLMVLGMATPGAFGLCPTTLQLGVCVDLRDLLKANVGVPPSQPSSTTAASTYPPASCADRSSPLDVRVYE